MTQPLCPTCAIEHAVDNVRVECSKRGFVQPQTECAQYRPTREKLLEDALRELCDAVDRAACDDEHFPGYIYDAFRKAGPLVGFEP